jgi:hypothetical protein
VIRSDASDDGVSWIVCARNSLAAAGVVFKCDSEFPMKVGAHPLVVAVALGLLGPNALAEEREEREERREEIQCEACDGSCVQVCEDEDDAAAALEVQVQEVWAEMVDLRVDPDA